MARLVGPYEILEEYGPRRDGILGTGGMGTVYAVRQYPFDELHAIKVLHPGLLETPECNRRFAREARIMWELGSAHPNILAVTDFRESDGGMT
jgi:serine/threonine-protein kinase